jgi:hypothetical protein
MPVVGADAVSAQKAGGASPSPTLAIKITQKERRYVFSLIHIVFLYG